MPNGIAVQSYERNSLWSHMNLVVCLAPSFQQRNTLTASLIVLPASALQRSMGDKGDRVNCSGQFLDETSPVRIHIAANLLSYYAHYVFDCSGHSFHGRLCPLMFLERTMEPIVWCSFCFFDPTSKKGERKSQTRNEHEASLFNMGEEVASSFLRTRVWMSFRGFHA